MSVSMMPKSTFTHTSHFSPTDEKYYILHAHREFITFHLTAVKVKCMNYRANILILRATAALKLVAFSQGEFT